MDFRPVAHMIGKMSAHSSKRSVSNSTIVDDSGPSKKKRTIPIETVEKWIRENDKMLQTASWLKYDKGRGGTVASLKCKLCIRYREKLESCKNYSAAFILGSKNLRTSAFKDHAKSEMHLKACSLFTRSKAVPAVDYAPIARALERMDANTASIMKRKFEIAYFICKQHLPFTEMGPICGLEEKHGVNLGTGYKNDKACAVFAEFIAQERREALLNTISKAKFFSIQADGTTDKGNIEEEMFHVVYCDFNSDDMKVQVCNRFLAVRQPTSGNAAGLFECFKQTMEYINIPEAEWRAKLVGYGCDGASVNVACNGLKGYFEEAVPWIIMFWCLAHRLELAVKDALKSTLFDNVDDMLMRAYYIYKRSPKKCRELEEIVTSLKQCLDDGDMPDKGNKPIRACGTRFIDHKVAAMNRFVDRFGAYLSHLCSLTEDRSVSSPDRQKLKGYVLKWQNGKMLLACALFADLLKPVAILSKSLQYTEVNVIEAIEGILRTKNAIEKLKTTAFVDLPTVKKVMLRVQHSADETESDAETTYQGTKITHYEASVDYLSKHKNEYMEAVIDCLRNRVKVQHVSLLTDILAILATHGWNRTESDDFADVALQNIANHFSVPLTKAGVDLLALEEEWLDMVYYAKTYLNLVQDDSHAVWWKLANCANSKKWENILALVELMFCLPMSNGHLEQVFSTLKMIKTERRTSLGESQLDNLLRIAVDSPPLSNWDPSGAVQLWWEAKQRRTVQDTRAPPRRPQEDIDSTAEAYQLDLSDWDDFVAELDSDED